MRKAIIGAVLTGDIVNSTKLLMGQEERLIQELDQYQGQHLHEFYRGDSFQVYMDKPADALRTALLYRALAIGMTGNEESEVVADIRISIGIGEVKLPIHQLGVAKGEAFLLSGRRFDKFRQEGQRLAISSGEPLADIGFQVMADYLDSIYSTMTGKQAEVIGALLEGVTQQQVAVKLGKSKSTVSQLANAGKWPEIERLLEQYELLVNKLI